MCIVRWLMEKVDGRLSKLAASDGGKSAKAEEEHSSGDRRYSVDDGFHSANGNPATTNQNGPINGHDHTDNIGRFFVSK